ncbi:CARD- and ANK-domain containing inflammasome adapter protein [Lycodopsis pacificus]
MLNILKGFDAQAASTCINPYAVEVIRVKRRDLVYGISHTENLLDLLGAEGVMTAARRSVVLTIRTRMDQNSRVLDHLEARGERAGRIFFHPCLMLAEPDLYQRIKTYAGGVNERVRDARRQLIGYLLERDEPKAAQSKPEHLILMIASEGDVVLLEEPLKDANSSNETLLHVAAERGHLSAIELLIRKGARLDLQDKKGHTALHRAAGRGHAEAVGALAQAGAPISALELQDNPRGALSAEAVGSALFSAVDQNHDGVVTAVIDRGLNVNTDQQGYTPLLLSAELGHTEVFRFPQMQHTRCTWPQWQQTLLEKGLDPNITGPKAQTPLHLAAQCNRPELVGLLLRAGAQIFSCIYAVAQDGLTPLHIAGQQGHAGPVIRLLQGEADPGVRDSGVCLASQEAAWAKGGAKDMDGCTALHYAAAAGHAGAASALLHFYNKGMEESNAWNP